MIDAIGEFFRTRLQVRDDPLAVEESSRLAAAALLFETAMADYDLDNTERATIHALVCSQFSLSDVDSKALLALAESQVKEATDLYGFTSLINKHWTEQQRLTLVEQMWRVVYADGRLDDHELHLMRKIQRLLHIPQRDFVAAKLRHKPN
jgi:uncharacterized tellurite resistance protein B-like protein